MKSIDIDKVDQTLKSVNQKLKTVDKVDQIIFGVLIFLALVGASLTDISPRHAHGYWVGVLMVYAFAAIYSGRQSALMKKRKP